jgi:hypothetical protein
MGEMTIKEKRRIDRMTYQEMLHKWCFAPVGDPMFAGKAGDYFREVMMKKGETADKAAVSKRVGW